MYSHVSDVPSSSSGTKSRDRLRRLRGDIALEKERSYAVTHILSFLLLMGILIHVELATVATIAFACTEVARFISIPWLTLYSICHEHTIMLSPLLWVSSLLGTLDLFFATWFVIFREPKEGGGYGVLDGTLTELYRHAHLLMGLPTLLRGALLLFHAVQLYRLRQAYGRVQHLMELRQDSLLEKSNNGDKQRQSLNTISRVSSSSQSRATQKRRPPLQPSYTAAGGTAQGGGGAAATATIINVDDDSKPEWNRSP